MNPYFTFPLATFQVNCGLNKRVINTVASAISWSVTALTILAEQCANESRVYRQMASVLLPHIASPPFVEPGLICKWGIWRHKSKTNTSFSRSLDLNLQFWLLLIVIDGGIYHVPSFQNSTTSIKQVGEKTRAWNILTLPCRAVR